MATYETYDVLHAGGEAEDVEDIIQNIDPVDTPFFTNSKRGKAMARTHEWLQDELRAPGANRKIEGADAGSATHTPPGIRSNYTQIFDEVAQVSGTLEEIKKYGRTSELAYELAKKAKEVKLDIEWTIVGGGAQTGTLGASGTARQLKDAYNSVDATHRIDNDDAGGGTAAFAESKLLAALQKCFLAGSNPDMLMVHPGHSEDIAAFAAASGRSRDFGEGKRLVNAVDIYVSPYGEVSVVLNRTMLDAAVEFAWVLDMDYWKVCTLRPTKTTPLAKTGDSTKVQIITELTLACMHDKASVVVHDIADPTA